MTARQEDRLVIKGSVKWLSRSCCNLLEEFYVILTKKIKHINIIVLNQFRTFVGVRGYDYVENRSLVRFRMALACNSKGMSSVLYLIGNSKMATTQWYNKSIKILLYCNCNK